MDDGKGGKIRVEGKKLQQANRAEDRLRRLGERAQSDYDAKIKNIDENVAAAEDAAKSMPAKPTGESVGPIVGRGGRVAPTVPMRKVFGDILGDVKPAVRNLSGGIFGGVRPSSFAGKGVKFGSSVGTGILADIVMQQELSKIDNAGGTSFTNTGTAEGAVANVVSGASAGAVAGGIPGAVWGASTAPVMPIYHGLKDLHNESKNRRNQEYKLKTGALGLRASVDLINSDPDATAEEKQWAARQTEYLKKNPDGGASKDGVMGEFFKGMNPFGESQTNDRAASQQRAVQFDPTHGAAEWKTKSMAMRMLNNPDATPEQTAQANRILGTNYNHDELVASKRNGAEGHPADHGKDNQLIGNAVKSADTGIQNLIKILGKLPTMFSDLNKIAAHTNSRLDDMVKQIQHNRK